MAHAGWKERVVGFRFELVVFSVKNKAVSITGLLSHVVFVELFDSATVAQK